MTTPLGDYLCNPRFFAPPRTENRIGPPDEANSGESARGNTKSYETPSFKSSPPQPALENCTTSMNQRKFNRTSPYLAYHWNHWLKRSNITTMAAVEGNPKTKITHMANMNLWRQLFFSHHVQMCPSFLNYLKFCSAILGKLLPLSIFFWLLFLNKTSGA